MPQYFPEINPETGEFVSPLVRDRYAPRDWAALTKPAVIAAGTTAAEARSAIGLGTAATQSSGAFAPADYAPSITGLPAGTNDTTRVLAPNGTGGVQWVAAPTGGGGSLTPDPDNAGLYLIESGAQLTADPANPGLYLIGA